MMVIDQDANDGALIENLKFAHTQALCRVRSRKKISKKIDNLTI